MNKHEAIAAAIKLISGTCQFQRRIDAGRDEEELKEELKERFNRMWTQKHEKSGSADWMLVCATEYARRISHKELERYVWNIERTSEGETIMLHGITDMIISPTGAELSDGTTYYHITEFRNSLKGHKFYVIED